MNFTHNTEIDVRTPDVRCEQGQQPGLGRVRQRGRIQSDGGFVSNPTDPSDRVMSG
jgi:hypothetical protein